MTQHWRDICLYVYAIKTLVVTFIRKLWSLVIAVHQPCIFVTFLKSVLYGFLVIYFDRTNWEMTSSRDIEMSGNYPGQTQTWVLMGVFKPI